jgi:DNA ligase D-like protein (predicted polymerase)/DNA ligase D-like protein (predicted 3'-phosphoesterase)
MSLKKYKSKRNLEKSKEPIAKKKTTLRKKLNFVVQEHAARRLHYDLRLEVDGVLKSWAVPKGPSLDPKEKRLAVMVEDHPYDYQFFEGVIPEGYGAGKVRIWDHGTYNVKELNAKESEKQMRWGLKKGVLHFTLKGNKLKGEYTLIRLKKENQWLLVKKNSAKDLSVPKLAGALFAGVQLSHLDKIFWPKEKITKGDLLNYYKEIAPYIIPYLKDRPQSMNRFPDGIEGAHFYQKNLINHPDWIQTISLEQKDKAVNYLLIQDLKSLLYAVNLGCIEMHPFFSKVQSIDAPDFLTFDLDPEGISFDAVVLVALEFHRILEKLSLSHFCKTSGASGMHICLPLGAKYTYEEAKNFALVIANLVHQKLPKITSLERKPQNRQKKVYLDCLQNNKGQTLASVYSVRPVAGAPVSTPLLWEEVKKGLNPKDFHLFNTLKRIKKMGDLFKGVLGKGISIPKALKAISQQINY